MGEQEKTGAGQVPAGDNGDAAKAAEELKKILETPIGEDEARLGYADIEMKEAQLLLLREQVLGQLNLVDQQLAGCRCARAEITRRLANPKKEA